MEIELKNALDAHSKAIEDAIAKYDGQLAEQGKADEEIRNEVKSLSERFKAEMDEMARKMESAPAGDAAKATVGEEFVKSAEFKALASRQTNMARVEIKSTVLTDQVPSITTVQRPGVIAGDFLPITIRSRIPTINVTGNAVNALREATWVNNAAETAEGEPKPESDITFSPYNVAIETVAHWIKVSNQLMADAPAVVDYINTRLRDGLAQRIERQLLLGDGVTPNLSGLTDAGNFTAFTPAAGANLVESINAAKYQLWAIGDAPDTVIVNPADWGAMELAREGAGTGAYLYGAPGTAGGLSPFGVSVVLSSHMPAGQFLIGNLRRAATIYQRQGVVVEMGFVNDDFTRNLVTIRAEERLGLGVDRPQAILYGGISGE